MKYVEVQRTIDQLKQELLAAQAALQAAKEWSARLAKDKQAAIRNNLSEHNAVYRACGRAIGPLTTLIRLKNYYEPRPHYVGPEGDDFDGWDPGQYPETKKVLAPLVQLAEATLDLYQQTRQDLLDKELREKMPTVLEEADLAESRAAAEVDRLTKLLNQAALDLKWACDDLPVAGHVIDQINQSLKEHVPEYVPSDEISIDTDGNVCLHGLATVVTQARVSREEQCTDLSELDALSAEDRLDALYENLERVITSNKQVGKKFDVDVRFLAFNTSYDGETCRFDEYFEADTGYREPAGDFYVGPVSACTEISISITLVKQH